jgi:hypothetical protein
MISFESKYLNQQAASRMTRFNCLIRPLEGSVTKGKLCDLHRLLEKDSKQRRRLLGRRRGVAFPSRSERCGVTEQYNTCWRRFSLCGLCRRYITRSSFHYDWLLRVGLNWVEMGWAYISIEFETAVRRAVTEFWDGHQSPRTWTRKQMIHQIARENAVCPILFCEVCTTVRV